VVVIPIEDAMAFSGSDYKNSLVQYYNRTDVELDDIELEVEFSVKATYGMNAQIKNNSVKHILGDAPFAVAKALGMQPGSVKFEVSRGRRLQANDVKERRLAGVEMAIKASTERAEDVQLVKRSMEGPLLATLASVVDEVEENVRIVIFEQPQAAVHVRQS